MQSRAGDIAALRARQQFYVLLPAKRLLTQSEAYIILRERAGAASLGIAFPEPPYYRQPWAADNCRANLTTSGAATFFTFFVIVFCVRQTRPHA